MGLGQQIYHGLIWNDVDKITLEYILDDLIFF